MYLTIVACVVWFFRSHRKRVVPTTEHFVPPTPKEALRIFGGGIWALLLPVIILVGLHSGKFTATEAGVIACVYALLIGLLVYRELKIKNLGKVFVNAAKTSAVVMFLAAAANVAAYYMTVSRIPQILTGGLEGLVENRTLLMIVLMLIVIVVGLAMDVTPSILILTPIMIPLVEAAGINKVYFGVCFVLMNVLGLTSPPVGPVLNVACAAGNVSDNALFHFSDDSLLRPGDFPLPGGGPHGLVRSVLIAAGSGTASNLPKTALSFDGGRGFLH